LTKPSAYKPKYLKKMSVYKPKCWNNLLYLQQKFTVMNKDLAKIIIAENQKLISDVKFYQRDYQFDEHLNYVLVG